MEEVSIQYFQSVIAIELGVAGALVWEIGFFAPADWRRSMVSPTLGGWNGRCSATPRSRPATARI
jgi:hypothetical protein